MQVFKTTCFILAVIALTLATEVQPSAAMVIYPWCANYGGGGKGGYGASSCGFVSFHQCLATLSGNGGPAVQIHGISPIRHRRRMLHP